MRPLTLILFLFAAAGIATAAETNYFCVVCGKGPLTGRLWMSKWGAVCDECYKLENHCTLCGLPIREGDGAVKTGDGRLICKFDKKNVVMDAEAAKEIFADARHDLVGLFGQQFALNFPEVAVNVFDVDYWSEKGRGDGLHKFGFSHTRKTPRGQCTHEVVMLSGELRNEIVATAAHEYTHLWINENRPANREIAGDTLEAICELAAYELMGSRSQLPQQKQILENPYTHGEIKKLIEVEAEHGFGYILNWVKDGATTNFEPAARAVPVKVPVMTFTNIPAPLPATLKLGGLLFDGQSRHAIVSGVSFGPGETKLVRLHGGPAKVRCREIRRDEVVLEVDGLSGLVTLKIGDEKSVP
jgi:hypothetical protein